MICLDRPQNLATADQLRSAVDQIRGDRGAEFIYSERFACWIIVCRDAQKKRQLIRRYRAGVPIYTLAEVANMAKMSDAEQVLTHDLITEMGATIE